MMHRCYNPKREKYKDYGGRGITVCNEWHDPNTLNGASLRASGWICDGEAGGTHWTGKRYEQMEIVLDEKKVRWHKEV